MKRLFQPLHPAWIVAFGAAILGGLYALNRAVATRVAENEQTLAPLKKAVDQAVTAHDHFSVLKELKTSDLDQFKAGFSNLALSRKTLFESGLSLQEERRLLDKQLEIMTTYMIINPALQRVFLMRGEQPLQSYLISYIPLRAFGGAPETLPSTVRIISKERFANPERGKSEEVNGKLQYTPPQVGTSVRSNALGEYVMFTNSKLILHGPPLNPDDHERFPHVCLGLDIDAAKRLYTSSFIGTRIILNGGAASPKPHVISSPVSVWTSSAPVGGPPAPEPH